jgi:uncharacterized membrane protein SirB2
MEMYVPIKMIHMLAAYITGILLLLRLGLDASGRPNWRNTPLRWIPHVNDTILLVMAISLLGILRLNIFEHSWALLKIVFLFGYIAAAVFAMKPKFPTRTRMLAAVLAILQWLFIFYLAIAKPYFW